MPAFTRQQYQDARRPDCSWTAEAIRDALAARFPGDDPIELLDLLDSWIADESLSAKTLKNAHALAQAVSGIGGKAGNLLIPPRKAMELYRAKVAAREEGGE